MNISSENKRITVTDNPELALTENQKKVFAHWEAGFVAQASGARLEDCPVFNRYAYKIRKLWREGWLAGAAVDRIQAGWLAPSHNPTQANAIR
jgi:hypothetical protein